MQITTNQLKRILADYAKVPEPEASAFVDALVGTLLAHVQKGESISIQGFGTFQVVEAQQGQLRRVAFKPDASLKEAVNAPFSFFEPVVLAQAKVEPVARESEPAKEPLLPEPETTEVAEEIVLPEAKPVLPEEPAIEQPEPPVAEAVEPVEAVVTPQPQPVGNEEGPHVKKVVPKKPRKKKLSRFTPVVCLLIVVFVALGTFYLLDFGPSFLKQGEEEPHTTDKEAKHNANVIASPQLVEADSLLDEEILSDPEVIETLTGTAAKPATTAKPGDKLPYLVDAKTGQPRLVKVAIEEKMSDIAAREYGHREFWSYIYELNKEQLGHPNHSVEGKKLMLPNPEYFDIDAKNPASVRKARLFGYEIYGRFKK